MPSPALSEQAFIELYERLLLSRPEGVLLGRADGTVLRANPAACRMLQRSEAEVCALGRGNLVVPTPGLERLVEQRERDGAVAGELQMRRADSSVFPIEFSSSKTVLASGESVTLTTFRDISEQRRVAAELQASEERLRLFVDHAPAAIAMLDRSMVYLAVSRRWLVDYRVGPDVIGKCHYDVFPDLPGRWKEVHRRCLEGAVESAVEDPFPRLDGTVDWVDWEIHPWRTRHGDIGGLILFSEVVTERKLAAEAHQRLQQALQESQRMESIGRLAGGVAHDFNNLLTVILSCAEDLKEGLGPADPQLQEDAREIAEAGERARDLTKQLLAFARRQVFASKAVDVAEIVGRSERMLRRVIGEDIRLRVDSAPDLWLAQCDPRQLEQIVLNLAVNARDAMQAGGELRIAARNFAATAADAQLFPGMAPGEYVRLSVGDSGEGMSEEVKARIFEPFFTTKQAGRGTGLGLATVYGIVKQSGGHIRVDSAPGRGTTFDICLPRAPEMAGADADAEAALPGARGTETVLLVEDDPVVREVSVRALRAGGYRVVTANSGADAIAAFGRQPVAFDLLVSDVVMPGMSGLELADRLRADAPQLRVLFVSGYAAGVVAPADAMKPGFEFLPKPFTPSLLLQKVRAVLDAARPRDTGRR